jgi:hypothetical protein
MLPCTPVDPVIARFYPARRSRYVESEFKNLVCRMCNEEAEEGGKSDYILFVFTLSIQTTSAFRPLAGAAQRLPLEG